METLSFQDQLKHAGELFTKSTTAMNLLSLKYGEGHYKQKFIAEQTTIHYEHFLNLKAAISTFDNREWWKNEIGGNFTEEEINYSIGAQHIHIKFFFFIKLFSIVENQFRLLTKKIDPNSERHTGSFSQVYRFVLTHFNLLEDYKDVFDLCRHIRNGIHNRGFHTGKTEVVIYRGKEYEFVQNTETLMFNVGLQYLVHNELFYCALKIANTEHFDKLP